MSRSRPSWLATVLGDAYTLHFWPPYGDPGVQQAKHYTGWAEEGRLRRRLVEHALGRGARLTQVQREAGGSWVLAGVEQGVTRDRETQLKERGASRRCDVCRAATVIAEPVTGRGTVPIPPVPDEEHQQDEEPPAFASKREAFEWHYRRHPQFGDRAALSQVAPRGPQRGRR